MTRDQIRAIAEYYGHDDEVETSPGQWTTYCPVHERDGTHNPSLYIGESPRNKRGYATRCRAGCKFKDIATQFENDGLVVKNDYWGPAGDGKIVLPAQDGVPIQPTCKIGKQQQPPSALWEYRSKHGELLFYVGRFIDATGEKTFRRMCQYEHKDDGRVAWFWRQPKGWDDIPLYGLQDHNDGIILIVEGEKTRDAAQALFPEFWCLTYSGGGGNWANSKWEVLGTHRKIVIWPDRDEAGQNMSRGLGKYLIDQGHDVSIVNVWDTDLPRKWDLADKTDLDVKAIFANQKGVTSVTQDAINQLCKVGGGKCGRPECSGCEYFGRFENASQVDAVGSFIRDYIYVNTEDKIYVRKSGSLYSRGSFNYSMAHVPGFTTGGQNGAAEQLAAEPLATKVDNIITWPGREQVFVHNGALLLNAWKPWKERQSDEEPTLWIQLGEHLFGDSFEYVLDYMATTLRTPSVKINHGMIITTKTQGTGKSSFFTPLTRIMGQSARIVSNEEITDRNGNNGYLLGKKLIVVEEIYSPGHATSHYERLKTLTAAPPDELPIREKYTKAMTCRNLVSVIAFSNHEAPIKIDPLDRRWWLCAANEKKLPQSFFKKFWEWLGSAENEGPGLAAIQTYLMKRSVAHFETGQAPPMTATKQMVIKKSDYVMAHIQEMIDEGLPPFTKDLVLPQEIVDGLAHVGVKTTSLKIGRALSSHSGFTSVGKLHLAGYEIPREKYGVNPRAWTWRVDAKIIKFYLEQSPVDRSKSWLSQDQQKGKVSHIDGKPFESPF